MPILLFIAFALAVALYINTPLADPDLWWHIVSGRWIISNHSLPTEDLWTQLGSGKPWTAYSWSNEIVYAFVDRHFGISGLFHLQASMAFILALSLFYLFGRISKSYVLGSLLGATVLTGCLEHFSLRPQTFIWILFALLFLNCSEIEEKGLKKSSLLSLIVIFCLWANTHISTILGIISCLLWLLPFPIRNNKTSLRNALAVLAICFLATLITPYFGKEWLIFFSKTGHPFQFNSVTEFGPATILNISTCILLLMAFLALSFWIIKKDSIRFFQFILAATLCFGSLLVVKFVPFALICLGCIIAKQWGSNLPAEKPGIVEGLKKLESMLRWIPVSGLTFLLLCIAFLNYSKSKQELIDSDQLPIAAANMINDLKLDGRLMNSFGDGGYLMYRFSSPDGQPVTKVSIDGRTNLIDHEVWHEYEMAKSGFWGWDKYMKRIDPEIIIWRADSPFIRLLEAGGKWCSVLVSGGTLNSSVLMLKKEKVSELQNTGKQINCRERLGPPVS